MEKNRNKLINKKGRNKQRRNNKQNKYNYQIVKDLNNDKTKIKLLTMI